LEKSFHPEPPKEEHQQSLPFGRLILAFHQASGNQRFQNSLIKFFASKDNLRLFPLITLKNLKMNLAFKDDHKNLCSSCPIGDFSFKQINFGKRSSQGQFTFYRSGRKKP
jgi:hypothetical protein